MYISNETKEQTEKRLTEVLKTATFKVFELPYFFKETQIIDFQFEPNALAMIKDFEVWSYLIPSESEKTENFKIFSFHFKEGMDNSGFVGWLASKIKIELGSGLFVICGQNSNRGGIFDYWGCPIEIADEVLEYIKKLTE
jgi:hypothetical protein